MAIIGVGGPQPNNNNLKIEIKPQQAEEIVIFPKTAQKTTEVPNKQPEQVSEKPSVQQEIAEPKQATQEVLEKLANVKPEFETYGQTGKVLDGKYYINNQEVSKDAFEIAEQKANANNNAKYEFGSIDKMNDGSFIVRGEGGSKRVTREELENFMDDLFKNSSTRRKLLLSDRVTVKDGKLAINYKYDCNKPDSNEEAMRTKSDALRNFYRQQRMYEKMKNSPTDNISEEARQTRADFMRNYEARMLNLMTIADSVDRFNS